MKQYKVKSMHPDGTHDIQDVEAESPEQAQAKIKALHGDERIRVLLGVERILPEMSGVLGLPSFISL